MNEVLTAAEVANWLRVSKSKVYEMARTGQLEPVRVGRAVRFRREAVERAIGRPASRSSPRGR